MHAAAAAVGSDANVGSSNAAVAGVRCCREERRRCSCISCDRGSIARAALQCSCRPKHQHAVCRMRTRVWTTAGMSTPVRMSVRMSMCT